MSGAGCDYVTRYLERFLEEGARSAVDLEQVGDHVGACPQCYQRLSQFFRTIELPEPGYLRETIDELALALYNLAKAIIRDRPAASPEDQTDNLRITVPGGGSASENLQAGVEMIEDAEDYTGTSRVGGTDLEEVRAEIHRAADSQAMRIDLALALFERITRLPSRYQWRSWNWIGVLHLQKGEFDAAEAGFLKVLAGGAEAREVRTFAHCNLAYVFKHRGDLDRAIRSARRSAILAEEDGEDTYFGRFAEFYFRMLRGAADDESEARRILSAIILAPGGRAQLVADLKLPSNGPVLDTFRNSRLAKDFSELISPPPAA